MNSSTRRFLFPSFLGLSALEGIFCFIWFLHLPRSEAERAIIFGFSITRLTVLLIFGVVNTFLFILFVRCLTSPPGQLKIESDLKAWFEKHDFFTTALLACLAGWGILGLAFEILLNPDWFPRSILYHFLYIRVRPIFLWTVLTGVQALALILAHGWYRLREEGMADRDAASLALWGAVILAAGNLALWGIKAAAPILFNDQNGLVLAGIVILVLIEVGVAAALHFRWGKP